MDGIDWQHHIGEDADGTTLYKNVGSLVRCSGHPLTECGIVELEVRLVRWVEPQKLPVGDPEKIPDTEEP
jgi:hypothetical protein